MLLTLPLMSEASLRSAERAAAADQLRHVLVACVTILGVGMFLRAFHVVWKFDVDWEPDGYQHILFAQSVFAAPPASLWFGIDVWAKPVYTLVVAAYDALLPASAARVPAVQLLNTLFWFLAMVVVTLLAHERCRHWATVIAVCVTGSFSYVFFRDSITANTEPIGALLFALGLWLWHRRRHTAALLLFGLLPLARVDAALFAVVFWAAAIWNAHRLRERSFVRSAVVTSLVLVAPTAAWNLAGFVHTGSPVFLFSHGYSSARGLFGFGRPLQLVIEFLEVDTVLFLFYWTGIVRVVYDRRGRDQLLVLLAVSTFLYFIVISATWVLGASAGLLRYFVFAYPAYLLVAAAGFDWLFLSLARVAPRMIPVTLAIVVVATLGGLHWLVRPPEWHHSLLTSLRPNPLRRLPDNPSVRTAKMIYTDRPEVLYYLHRNFVSPDIGQLQQARDPSAKGLFVFVQGWSETYGNVRLEDFGGMEQLDRFSGPYGETIYIFRR